MLVFSPPFAAGPGLDQSGFDGEEIIRVHLIRAAGRQNHQVLSSGAASRSSHTKL